MSKPFQISILGDVSVKHHGTPQTLVASRKTRALLAYLVVTGRPHRRAHLCDMFFSSNSDPRAGLRWSLTKLRHLFEKEDPNVLYVNGDTVGIDISRIDIDVEFVRRAMSDPSASIDMLRQAAELVPATPFDTLELARVDDFDLWLLGERDEMQNMRWTIIERLCTAPDLPEHEAMRWLRLWARLDPYSHDAPRALWSRLMAARRLDEAEAVRNSYENLMGEEAEQWTFPPPATSSDPASQPLTDGPKRTEQALVSAFQTIGFCKSDDGVRIAYASVGSGPPIVKAANWLNHLELDWESPIWGDTFRMLAERHTLLRYDERGNGLSDWDVPEISFESFVRDLEVVVDHLNLDRFPLLGMSQGCAVSIDYAVRHPERVSALILIGGYAAGWRIGLSREEQEQREAVLTLTRHGWGMSNPSYRHIFSQTFMPDADSERLAWFDEFQRKTTSPENAVRFQEAFGTIDVRHLLPQVQVPTLVLHARDDQRIPLECSRELAADIPNARLVTLESRSHIILGDEPAWQTCMTEIRRFLDEIA